MVTSCYVLKRRKNHLKGKTLTISPSPDAPVPDSIVVETTAPTAALQNITDYSSFRLDP